MTPDIRVGVERHVGGAPPSAGLHPALVARLLFECAIPAAAVHPRRFRRVRTRARQVEGRSTHSKDIRRNRRILHVPAVSTGRDERNPLVPGRRREIRVVRRLVGHLIEAPAHRDGHHARRVPRRVHRIHQILQSLGLQIRRRRLHHQDVGAGRDCVCPLDIHGLFKRPPAIGLGTRLVHYRQRWRRQSVFRIERCQIRLDVRIVVHLDQRDRFPTAVSRNGGARLGSEGDVVQTIRGSDLGWRVSTRLIRRETRKQTAVVKFIQ